MFALLQLDAVSLPLIERLLDQGRLPALAALRDEGTWIPIETPARYLPPSTYQTLYSGLEPEQHGQHYPIQWSAKDQRVRFRQAFPAPVAMWERLALAGRRALVIDPYESQPPRLFEGFAASGWQFENVLSLDKWSDPPGLGKELARRFGAPELMQEVFGRPTSGQLVRSRRQCLGASARVADAAVALLQRGPFELLMANFVAGHLAGHLFWDLSQLPKEELEPETRKRFESTLEDVYVSMDTALGRIVAALPPDCDIAVVSALGMGENTTLADLAADMLGAVLGGNGAGPKQRAGVGELLWHIRGAFPTSVRSAVARAAGARITRELTARMSVLGIDWDTTRAFLVPSDHFAQVRLNVRGRERKGIVEPSEADALMDEIAAGFLSLRDADGAPVVKSVDRIADVFPEGRLRHQLPDLIVRWGDRPAREIFSVYLGDVEIPRRSSTGRSGAHTADAWALLRPARSRLREPSRPPRLVDLAATVCALAGVETDGLAGEPLLEAAQTRRSRPSTSRA